jgi:hypothetical protein
MDEHGGYPGGDLGNGPISLTLRFKDISDLDEFADIAQSVWWQGHTLTEEQDARWTRFTVALKSLLSAAPRTTIEGVHAGQEALFGSRYDTSYHASIDARRDVQADWDAARDARDTFGGETE